MKYIEMNNPFVKGGIARYPVIRETKTLYICKNTKFRKKLQIAEDGMILREVGASRFDPLGTLRIVK